MAGTNQEKPKKSFEFRMSKKVAELTQVVHMLFTRNHEKEVEIDALKKAYEKEIELAIGDARGKISILERSIEEQSNQNNRARNLEMKNKEEEMLLRDAERQKKLAESERLLQEERCENQNLRDLLINAQGDIEKLRQGVTDELSSKSDEIRRRDREMEHLVNQLSATSAELKRSQTDAQTVIAELQKTNERLEEDMQQLHDAMDNTNKSRDQLINRNKQLEHDMKSLKREFNRKLADMANNNQMKNPKNNLSAETNLELERLRREVQRYRLELSNRDLNFNRMFTEKQPMLINQRGNASNSKQSAIYTTPLNQGNHAMPPSLLTGSGNGNTNLLNHNVPHPLKDRQHTRTSLMEMDRHYNLDRQNNGIERQATFADRISSGDRLLQNGYNKEEDNRPQTQATAFMHERVLGNGKDRHLLKQQQQTALFGEDPHQLLPQRPGTNGQERPPSSSLPSICSTPERRKTLVKPKPLPRELLYGK